MKRLGRSLFLAFIFCAAGSCQVAFSQSAPANDPTIHAGQLALIMDKFAEERDRRYMDMFKGLEELMNQRFSDQAVAVTAANVASEKAIQAAFAASEKATTAALTSAKEAVQKAEISSDKRFEVIDDIRSQIKELGALSLPRTEYVAEQTRMEAIETELARIVGALLLVSALVPIGSAVVVYFISKASRERELEHQRAGPPPHRGP